MAATYVISIETSVTQNGQAVKALPVWPAAFGDETTAPGYASQKIEYMADGKVERLATKKVTAATLCADRLTGPGRKTSSSQPSSCRTIQIGSDGHSARVHQVPKDPKKPDPNDTVKYDVLGAAVGDWLELPDVRLFVGPKALNVLESVHSNTAPGQMDGPDLRDVVDFGFFHLIARPLFLWLKWTHEHWPAIGAWRSSF